VSVKVLVDRPIPFPREFIEVSSVPEVLVELSICEARELGIKVEAKLKGDEENRILKD
jgi:hypothetical protein